MLRCWRLWYFPRNPDDESARARIREFVDKLSEQKPAMAFGRVIFSDQAFSRENGFLRPNLKLDRRRIAEHFLSGSGNGSKSLARSS